jgi:serine/threonine-protein kinase HipA
MSAAVPLPDEHTLYVVMNGRVVGDIIRTGKSTARLRYEDAAAYGFTPLSVSMPGPAGRYRETVLVPWVEALLPDRPETLRQWRRRFGVIEQGPLTLLPP